ncbi:MAG: alpha/beta fold hydrolase, partial [Deferribacteres bacterium]|nr:alpha/beta fold hydrolase [Deferribacteres bacterium]
VPMKPDTAIHRGDPRRPVAIFIHGLGVNRDFWVNPSDTKVFGGNIPMRVFAATPPEPCTKVQGGKRLTPGIVPDRINNLWTVVTEKGFNALCWSQRRPSGPMDAAVAELQEVAAAAERLFPGRPIALVGHSRGGLIARKFMERKRPAVKALVTIASPHAGSSLSRLGRYLSPVAPLLRAVLPEDTRGAVTRILKNIHELLGSGALKELLPDSGFIMSLQARPLRDVLCVSFGGTNPTLLTVYKWKKRDGMMYPAPLLTIPDSLLRVLPPSVIPEELKPGRGDSMVTAESAVLPCASAHYTLHANHISITWHRELINKTIEVLERL